MAFYKRSDLQRIAQAKLHDAELLLQHGRYSNAYYLGGYAVEIGLKACIARQIKNDVLPDKSLILETYSHNLPTLAAAAGLKLELKAEEKANPAFAANWGVVTQWSPEKRYEAVDAISAQTLILCIKGIFPWIQARW